LFGFQSTPSRPAIRWAVFLVDGVSEPLHRRKRGNTLCVTPLKPNRFDASAR